MAPSISIIIPTLGRQSLSAMLDSIFPQMTDDDAVVVVADGDQAFYRSLPMVNDDIASKFNVCLCSGVSDKSVYGNHQRNLGREGCTTDLLWFVDDDDVVTPDAMSIIRREMASDRSPRMFRMDHMGTVIPQAAVIREGNVAGPCLVVPNWSEMPRWPVPCRHPPTSDLQWIESVNEFFPIKFSTSMIYVCTNHSRGEV